MKKQNQLFTVLLFVLIFTSTSAQNDQPTFGDDVVDNPVTPINDYLPQALFTAVALGFYFFRKEAHKKA